MRQKILHPGCSPQSGKAAGVGEFQTAETLSKTLPTGVHSPTAHTTSQVCRCDARDGETPEKTECVARSGKLSRLAIAVPLLLIRFYQLTISPWIGPCCRFTPSCSKYAAEALKLHGFWRGSFLAVWRILRCQPWSKGGFDPVPPPRKK